MNRQRYSALEINGKKQNPDPGGTDTTTQDHAQLTTWVAETDEVGSYE